MPPKANQPTRGRGRPRKQIRKSPDINEENNPSNQSDATKSASIDNILGNITPNEHASSRDVSSQNQDQVLSALNAFVQYLPQHLRKAFLDSLTNGNRYLSAAVERDGSSSTSIVDISCRIDY